MASEVHKNPRRKSKKKKKQDDAIVEGGKKQFYGFACTQSNIDEILTGKDMDGSRNAEEAYVASLSGCAGLHQWGRERADCRFHIAEPDMKYKKGVKKLNAMQSRSQVDSLVFGHDIDKSEADQDESNPWLETEEFRGAFGGVVGEFKEFGGSKRLYPNAPVTKTVLDTVIHGCDLDDSMASNQDWIKAMADHAGVSSWNSVDDMGRFTGMTTNDIEGSLRMGKKLYAGCVNKVSHMSAVAFNRDMDASQGELEDYKTMLSSSYAGRPGWDKPDWKARFYAKGYDIPTKNGKRRFINAPGEDTVLHRVQFGHDISEKPEEGCYRYSQLMEGSAGKPKSQAEDMMHGRFHHDPSYGDGYVAGRRKVKGARGHDITIELACDDHSEVSSIHAGKPEPRTQITDVPKDVNSESRAHFHPPSRKALGEAARRGGKSKEIVVRHTGEGVAGVLGAGASRASSSQPPRVRARPNSAPHGSSAVGSTAATIYGRDFRPMSACELDSAFQPALPPDFAAPQRPDTSGELRDSRKSRASRSTPAVASSGKASGDMPARSATPRSASSAVSRGLSQGSPRGPARCTPRSSAGSRGQDLVRSATQRGSVRRSTARGRP